MITRRHGTVGSEIWPALSEDQKECVLRQIGLHDGGDAAAGSLPVRGLRIFGRGYLSGVEASAVADLVGATKSHSKEAINKFA